MKKIIAWVLFAVAVIVILAVNAWRTEKEAVVPAVKKPVVKIGAIFPMSGNWELMGSQMRDGVLMRLQEQKQKPGLFKYEVTMEDDGGEPKRKNMAYLKLVNTDKCDVILDDAGNLLAPLAARDKKLFLNLSWDEKAAADSCAFIHCTPAKPQARMIADVLSRMGIKRVAVMCMIQQGFMAMDREFTAYAPTVGIATQTIKFNPDEIDFRGHLLKFYDFKPDAYLLLTADPSFEIIIRRIRELDKQTVITAVEGFTYLDDISAYNGYFYVAGNQPTQEFESKFKAEMNRKALGTAGFSGVTYDMLDLVIYAYETAGAKLGCKPTTAEAAEVLRNLKDYPGAIGNLTMGPNRVIQSPAVLKYIENGKATPVTIEELKKKSGK
jgi:ABC-type branched-subunit amino acid transport system substrate-binding protein